MENKKKEIAKFYGQILSDQKLKEKIVENAKRITNEEDLKKLIRKEIMPLTKKYNVNFSEEELLEYEEETLKELSVDMLENISGGVSLKPALVTGGVLAMALFGGIGLSSSIASADSGKGPGVQTQGKTATSSTSNNDKDDNDSDSDNDNDNDKGSWWGSEVSLDQNEATNFYKDLRKLEDKLDAVQKEAFNTALEGHGHVGTDERNIFIFKGTSTSGEVILSQMFTPNNDTELTIPESIVTKYGKVRVVGLEDSFFGNSRSNVSQFKKLTLAPNIVSFDFGKFAALGGEGSTLEEINFGNAKQLKIGKNAFSYTDTLKSVIFPNDMEELILRDHAFFESHNLEKFKFPEHCDYIDIEDNIFGDCKIKEINIEADEVKIDQPGIPFVYKGESYGPDDKFDNTKKLKGGNNNSENLNNNDNLNNSNNNDNDNNNLDNVNDNASANAQKELLKNAVNQQLENSEGRKLISESKMDMYMSEKAANGLAVAVGGEGIFSYISAPSGGVVLTDCYSNIYDSETLIIPSEVLTQNGDKLIVVGIGGEENFRNSNFKTIKIHSSTEEFTFGEGSFFGNKHIKTVDCSDATGLKKLVVSDGAFKNSSLKSVVSPQQVIEIIIADDALTGAPIEQYKLYSAPSMLRSLFNKATSISTYVLNKVKSIINLACIGEKYRADFAADLNNAIENNELNSLEQTDRELLLNADSLMRNKSYNLQINVQQNAEEEQTDNNNNQELKEIVSAGENNVMNVQQNVDEEEQKPEILLSSSGNENTDIVKDIEASQEVQVEAQLEEENEDTQETIEQEAQNQLEENADIVQDAETKQEDQSEENDKESGNEDNDDSDNDYKRTPKTKKKAGRRRRSRMRKNRNKDQEVENDDEYTQTESKSKKQKKKVRTRKRKVKLSDLVENQKINVDQNGDGDDQKIDVSQNDNYDDNNIQEFEGISSEENNDTDQEIIEDQNDDNIQERKSESLSEENNDADQEIIEDQNDNNIQEFEEDSLEENNNVIYTLDADDVLNISGVGAIGAYKPGDDDEENSYKSVNKITIGPDITDISRFNFTDFLALQIIEVDSNNQNYMSIDGVLYSKDGSRIICYPANKESSRFSIPEGVKEIGARAFLGSKLFIRAVDIPSSVKKIGERAFAESGIKFAAIPPNVTKIGKGAFARSLVKAVAISSGVRVIEEGTFENCEDLRSVYFSNIVSIGEKSFKGCKSLEKINLPWGLKKIGKEAFFGCERLKVKSFPYSLKVIDDDAFKGTNHNNIPNFPTNITNSDDDDDEIDNYDNDDNNEINNEENFDIREYERTYRSPTEKGNFTGGKSYWRFYEDGGVLVIGGTGAANVDSLHYSSHQALPWSAGKVKKLIVKSGITSIQEGLFFRHESLESVEIADSVKKIGLYAFCGCNNLKTIILGNGIEEIGSGAFNSCQSLRSVNIPKSVTEIGSGAFLNCTNLEYINIPPGVKKIEGSAFGGCHSLSKVIFPDSYNSKLSTIDQDAFNNCFALPGIVLPPNVKKIENNAFYGCNNLAFIGQLGQNIVSRDWLPYGVVPQILS